MNIYENAIYKVQDGAKFVVNFQERSLRINGEYIIQNAKYEGDLGVELLPESECLAQIEQLYRAYKHSVPSERSESKGRKYFKPLPERELDDEAMMYGQRRDVAQIELELFILCQIICGFSWNEESMGKWFWQSKNDKDLIILREWVEPKQNNN